MPGGMREAEIRKTVKERLGEEYWKVLCIMNIRLVRRWYNFSYSISLCKLLTRVVAVDT